LYCLLIILNSHYKSRRYFSPSFPDSKLLDNTALHSSSNNFSAIKDKEVEEYFNNIDYKEENRENLEDSIPMDTDPLDTSL